MKIDQRKLGAVTVVKLQGPISGDDATVLQHRIEQVMASSAGRIVLDLAATPFIDSGGLEVFLDTADQLSARGRTLKLCGLNATVREVLALIGLTGRFDLYDDVTTAARSFR
jgi:anti-anti-sigma factor